MAIVVAGTAPAAGLDVTSVDSSAYPTVVIDFVLPERYAAVDLTPAMVSVDGAPVEAVAPIDAGSVVVRIVVDDRPAVPSDVIGASQGGAVEFVRNTGAGAQIAIGTPSGLQTAVTADPGATIAGLAAITAGAPAVTPMPALILDSAAALAADASTDRHLVVALGGPLQASDAQLAQIADVVAASGITLHLLSAAGPPSPELTLIADESGGTAAESADPLVFFDTVAAAISNRYRMTTTLTAPGEHVVAVTIDGAAVTALVAVELPVVASRSPAPTTTPATTPSTTPSTLGEPAVVAGGVPTTAVLGTDDAAGSDDAGESPSRLIVVAMVVLAAVSLNAIALYWHRRRSRSVEAHEARSRSEKAIAVAELEIDVRPKPERPPRPKPERPPRPKPERASRPKPAVEQAATAEPGAAEEPVSKPKPTPTPKPTLEAVSAATATGSDVAEEAVPRQKPKRTRKPKPQSELSTEQEHDRTRGPELPEQQAR